MRPQEIIEKKRDGGELSVDEIDVFIDGVCEGTWADYQISALMMAMFIRGLNADETDALTRAMLTSGEVLDFSDIDGPKADKHSTGGVGDKTSLIIAPLVAACGVSVPMISGRGLGHTGGTLDKLESIPGYRVNLSAREFRGVLKKIGFAMAGQTAEIAPADKKLYALRDATATVPYVPLIVGSIMSKKLAEGLDALVLDVKTGSGAFMQRLDDSTRLAKALVETGRNFGVKTEAVISDMSQPLGRWVGNAHEVYECVQILRGDVIAGSTKALSVELSARMLVLAGVSPDLDSGKLTVNQKLANGEAFERFRKNVEMQGGDVAVCDDPEKLIDTKLAESPVKAASSGFITAIDTLAIGNAVAAIGGGRIRAEDKVDHAVAYASIAQIGDEIRDGEVLGVLHARASGDPAAVQILNAYKIDEKKVEAPSLLVSVVD
ncbi:MAG TPA: thymidine phosphorylase [Pyrinomonadaceae bacterium]|jgi:pyrimidine-nucleoside phosphorylase|nr:thymidine phosphorylase [Pyrinomonadaceae bacterium]